MYTRQKWNKFLEEVHITDVARFFKIKKHDQIVDRIIATISYLNKWILEAKPFNELILLFNKYNYEISSFSVRVDGMLSFNVIDKSISR